MRSKILIAAFAAAFLCGCAAHDIKLGKDTSAMDKRGESAAADCGASEGVCKVPGAGVDDRRQHG